MRKPAGARQQMQCQTDAVPAVCSTGELAARTSCCKLSVPRLLWLSQAARPCAAPCEPASSPARLAQACTKSHAARRCRPRLGGPGTAPARMARTRTAGRRAAQPRAQAVRPAVAAKPDRLVAAQEEQAAQAGPGSDRCGARPTCHGRLRLRYAQEVAALAAQPQAQAQAQAQQVDQTQVTATQSLTVVRNLLSVVRALCPAPACGTWLGPSATSWRSPCTRSASRGTSSQSTTSRRRPTTTSAVGQRRLQHFAPRAAAV